MDIEVNPIDWILPNRIGYNKKIYKTFKPEKYPKIEKKNPCKCTKDLCDVDDDVISLFPHQRMIKDYIQFDSPYRGVLLYHELGSGKSAASIAAAEVYIEKKNIFILSPASLAQNYENELLKVSKIGLNMKKAWSFVKIKEKNPDTIKVLNNYGISPTFIKKDNHVWIPLYNDDLPDTTIIKDKQSYKTLSKEDKLVVDLTIGHILKNKYKFISYNGLTQKIITGLGKDPFNNSFIVIDEIHNFISRVVNGSKLARSIYNSIMSASDCKIVLLSGTPIINSPYEIATLINLIRGPMNIYELSLLKKSAEPTMDEIKNILKELLTYIDEYSIEIIDNDKKFVYISLLPKGFKKESPTSENIIKTDWKATENKILENIVKELNKIPNVKISVNPKTKQFYALPNQKEEFDKIFMDNSDPDDPKVKNNDLFMRRILGTLSYYKITGTEFFPTLLPTNIEYLDMTDHQLNIYSEVRADERKIDNANKKKKARGGLFDNTSSVYRAYSRMVCNFAFPEEIKRQFPKDIRSNIALKEMLENEINAVDSQESGTGSLSEEDQLELKKVKEKKVKNVYVEELNKALDDLESNKGYLLKDSLKNLYSPKFSRMIENIEESPGTVLIYSQFRKVEGLGIFSMVLNTVGYKEIKIKKQGNDYIFEDEDEIFDEAFDNKRYVIFNEDRIKTNILMNLFNGAYSLLPKSLQDKLPKDNNQLHGKIVKIMMITQSGAEGISLKNVRRVLISEPFWNNVRISQVIGRAIRNCSHEQLPLDERNVQVFIYIMKFTKKQLEKDFTLRTLDNGLTTDQHILALANKKDAIINNFLNMAKAAAMDCINNSLQNKPLTADSGYKCYAWAINASDNDLSYTYDMKDDSKILGHKKLEVKRHDKGRVVSKDGKKYVLLNGKVYDYFSYVNAGVLIPISKEEIDKK